MKETSKSSVFRHLQKSENEKKRYLQINPKKLVRWAEVKSSVKGLKTEDC